MALVLVKSTVKAEGQSFTSEFYINTKFIILLKSSGGNKCSVRVLGMDEPIIVDGKMEYLSVILKIQ